METEGDESASDSELDEQQSGSEDEEQVNTRDSFVELSYEVLFIPDEEGNASQTDRKSVV